MALKLQKNFKGINADYWKILRTDVSLIENKTLVRIGLYVSEDVRKKEINNFLELKITLGFNSSEVKQSLIIFITSISASSVLIPKISISA